MIYKIKVSSRYKKAYRRMEKRGVDLSELDAVIDELKFKRRLDDKYQDHALKGKFKNFRECHIRPDWLLVYAFNDDVLTLLLFDTGTHSEIFGI